MAEPCSAATLAGALYAVQSREIKEINMTVRDLSSVLALALGMLLVLAA